jgi:hypothetical protein
MMLYFRGGIRGGFLMVMALVMALAAQRGWLPVTQAAYTGGDILAPVKPFNTPRPGRTSPNVEPIFTSTVTETLPTLPVETLPPTPTPTFTPTPLPQPVYLPLLFRSRRSFYLLNGGFESGAFLPGWLEGGTLARDIVGGGQQRSGKYAALLGSPYYNNRGGCPVGEASIQQVIDIPTQGHPTLRFWYRICSYDLKEFDYFAAYVSIWPDGPRNRVWIDGRDSWDTNLWCCPTWREGVVPLDEYLGRTITVTFANVMTNEDGWYNTWTVVDDVRLEERP